ncbi:MAG: hypothetical protein AAF217_02170 [Pseudomonadota bacterium]
MRTTSKLVAASFIAAVSMSGATLSAHAVSPNYPAAAVAKINGEGFRICKSMGDSGYTAVARGILGDGGGGDNTSGFRNFQIRTCFETRAQCEHFIDRIHHRISQIENLRYAGCSARS